MTQSIGKYPIEELLRGLFPHGAIHMPGVPGFTGDTRKSVFMKHPEKHFARIRKQLGTDIRTIVIVASQNRTAGNHTYVYLFATRRKYDPQKSLLNEHSWGSSYMPLRFDYSLPDWLVPRNFKDAVLFHRPQKLTDLTITLGGHPGGTSDWLETGQWMTVRLYETGEDHSIPLQLV